MEESEKNLRTQHKNVKTTKLHYISTTSTTIHATKCTQVILCTHFIIIQAQSVQVDKRGRKQCVCSYKVATIAKSMWNDGMKNTNL